MNVDKRKVDMVFMKEIKTNILKYKYNNQKCCLIQNLIEYFQISRKSLETIIKRNSDAINLYSCVLQGRDLAEFKKLNGLNSRINKLRIIFEECIPFLASCIKENEKAFDILKNSTYESINCAMNSYHKKYETELKYLIETILSNHHDVKYQFVDGCYRYDFLIDNKLVVECDENGHKYYDMKEEQEREKYIHNQGYALMRYNTRDNNMLGFIGEVYHTLEVLQ